MFLLRITTYVSEIKKVNEQFKFQIISNKIMITRAEYEMTNLACH